MASRNFARLAAVALSTLLLTACVQDAPLQSDATPTRPSNQSITARAVADGFEVRSQAEPLRFQTDRGVHDLRLEGISCTRNSGDLLPADPADLVPRLQTLQRRLGSERMLLCQVRFEETPKGELICDCSIVDDSGTYLWFSRAVHGRAVTALTFFHRHHVGRTDNAARTVIVPVPAQMDRDIALVSIPEAAEHYVLTLD